MRVKSGKLLRGIKLLLLFMLFINIVCPFSKAAGQAKNNHVDWANSCIHAYSLTMSFEEYQSSLESSGLEQIILAGSNPEIYYGPTGDIYTEGFQLADISALPSSAAAGTYTARLYMFSSDKSQDYIDIQIAIAEQVKPPDPEPTAPEPEPEPEPKPEPQAPAFVIPEPELPQEEIIVSEPSPEPEKKPKPKPKAPKARIARPSPTSKAEPKQRLLPENTYIAAYASSGAISFAWLLLIIPQVSVLRWYKKQKELSLTKTKKDYEREENDQ